MNQSDLIPINFVKLSDGKEATFCTGLFYSLRHKELNAPVTYLPSSVAPVSMSGEADNILVVRNNHAYLPGGTYANSTLFSVKKQAEFYQLFHKELISPVTYDPAGNAPRSTNVVADSLLVVRNRLHSAFLEYQPGGRWVNSTLFSILKEGDFYQLFHKELDAPVTYMPSDMAPAPRVGDRDNILVVRNSSHPDYTSYQPGGQWVNSTLFTFVPEKYRLSASIHDFKYADVNSNAHSTVGNTQSSMVWTVRNESLTETEVHNVEVTKVVENTTSWSFNASDERSFFQQDDIDVSISAEPFDVGESTGIDVRLLTDSTIHFTGDLVKWNKKTTPLEERKTVLSGKTTVSVTVDVHVPPRRSTEYILNWKRVDITSVPFTATVKISALADRLRRDESVSEMAPVDADGVISLMIARGYKGVLRKDGNNVVTSISGSVHLSGIKHGEITRRDLDFSANS